MLLVDGLVLASKFKSRLMVLIRIYDVTSRGSLSYIHKRIKKYKSVEDELSRTPVSQSEIEKLLCNGAVGYQTLL